MVGNQFGTIAMWRAKAFGEHRCDSPEEKLGSSPGGISPPYHGEGQASACGADIERGSMQVVVRGGSLVSRA